MADMEKVIKWLEYDYLPRVGAYRKDCKQGCDACMPMHDGDDYCDIDMLCKVLALLKEQEEKLTPKPIIHGYKEEYWGEEEICPDCGKKWQSEIIDTTHFCPGCGRAVKWE